MKRAAGLVAILSASSHGLSIYPSVFTLAFLLKLLNICEPSPGAYQTRLYTIEVPIIRQCWISYVQYYNISDHMLSAEDTKW